jgi:type II secretory pathway pseudopilin PulG
MNSANDNRSVAERWPRSRDGGRLAFTLIELLVTISVIILLAGLTVGVVTRASRSAREARLRAELNHLVTSIESYHQELGSYPPDNPANPAKNPLFYELVGVVVDNARGEFRTRDGSEVITSAQAKVKFGVDGFANAVTDPTKVRRFLDAKASQYAEITTAPDDVEVLVVPMPWPLNAAEHPIPEKPGLNPWRYLAGQNATNNPDSFDLWAEFVDGKHVRVLGNWRSDAVIDRDFVRR